MAIYPWIVPHQRQHQNLEAFANVKRWFERIGSMEAVRVAYEKGQAISAKPVVDEISRSVLFGQNAETVKR
jgi:GST-like protein